MAGCESVKGNTDDSCELTIEGHKLYCPNNPDDPACTEFLHNATNKEPAEVCNSPGCFKDQDPEKYCLNIMIRHSARPLEISAMQGL